MYLIGNLWKKKAKTYWILKKENKYIYTTSNWRKVDSLKSTKTEIESISNRLFLLRFLGFSFVFGIVFRLVAAINGLSHKMDNISLAIVVSAGRGSHHLCVYFICAEKVFAQAFIYSRWYEKCDRTQSDHLKIHFFVSKVT